jgi:hypothetical protein
VTHIVTYFYVLALYFDCLSVSRPKTCYFSRYRRPCHRHTCRRPFVSRSFLQGRGTTKHQHHEMPVSLCATYNINLQTIEMHPVFYGGGFFFWSLQSMFVHVLHAVAYRFTVGLVQNASTTLQHLDLAWYLVQSLSTCGSQFVLALLSIELGWLFKAATIISERNYTLRATRRAEPCLGSYRDLESRGSFHSMCVR